MNPAFNRETAKRYGIGIGLPPGDHAGAERFLNEISTAGITKLRLTVFPHVWNNTGGRDWYRWLMAEAAERTDVTAALQRSDKAPSPAWADDTINYERFATEVAGELGKYCEWLELADPLGPVSWPDHSRKAAALLGSLHVQSGCKVCLGGLPLHATWLTLARDQGLFAEVQGLAFCHPGPGANWITGLSKAVEITRGCGPLQLWLTPEQLESQPDDQAPVQRLSRELATSSAILDSTADRIYFHREMAGMHGHDAATNTDGKPDLVARILRSGGSRALQALTSPGHIQPSAAGPDMELVIGGAGFIGCNLAARLAEEGRRVLVFDDLSRPGTEHNAMWLQQRFPEQVQFMLADIRDADAVRRAVAGARRIFHFAAQVAVTTSLEHPLLDHSVNALGTLNVLEAARRQPEPPAIVFTSTNKVYGNLSDVQLQHTADGYEPVEPAIRTQGIGESRPLAFCSPYGCSKGAADQYILDYAHTFELSAAVLRMSCIYGPRQFGNEDQGWVAHFLRQALLQEPITLYGDGYQVRDVLYIDDLVNAALMVSDHLPAVSGEAFNVGGGPFNKVSLRSLLDRLAELQSTMPPVFMEDWRPGDQRYYVSDTTKLQHLTGWYPRVNVGEGLRQLHAWMREHLDRTATAPQDKERQISL